MEREPRIDEQKSYYDQWNLAHRRGSFDEIPVEIRLRALRVLEELEPYGLSDADILEVGCGTGWFSERLCTLGRVTGIDLSSASIDVAKQRGLEAEFIAADFHAQPFEPASFDLIVCVETLFYVVDQPRFVQKLASLLRPGGMVAVTTINKFVYERSSDVGAPYKGQVRNWLSWSETRRLLSGQFQILSMSSMEPRGDQGLLRVVNSYKVNSVLGRMFSPVAVKRAKERIRLGGGVVIIGRKRN